LADLSREEGATGSAAFLENLKRIEEIPWREQTVLLDGRPCSFETRSVSDLWCAFADFGDHSIAVGGYGIDLADCGFRQVDIIPFRRR
jgi:hypothetical protein